MRYLCSKTVRENCNFQKNRLVEILFISLEKFKNWVSIVLLPGCLTYLSLCILRGLTLGTACIFLVTSAGPVDDICRGHIIFVIPTVPKLLKVGPNSKQGKLSIDHFAFFQSI